MDKGNLQESFLIILPIILFVFLIVGTNWILPENCYLFDTRIQGLLCDGFDVKNPQSCPICEDDRIVSVAQIMFCLGFGFLFLPLVVFAIRGWRNNSAVEAKLFD